MTDTEARMMAVAYEAREQLRDVLAGDVCESCIRSAVADITELLPNDWRPDPEWDA